MIIGNVIKTKSWKESLEYAKTRKCDVVALIRKTKKRKKYLNFTKPFVKFNIAVITKNSVPFIDNFKDLKNKKIGISQHNSLKQIIQDEYPNLNIVDSKNISDGINKVKNGELFGYIGNLLALEYVLITNFIEDIKVMNILDNISSPLSVGIRNDDNVLFGIFNKLIANIDSKTKEKILKKYREKIHEKEINHILILKISIVFLLITFISILFLMILHKKNKKLEHIQKEINTLNESLKTKIQQEISKNEKQQTIVLQEKKMADLGMMLSAISHQWRQPLAGLSILLGNIKQLKTMNSLDDKVLNQHLEYALSNTKYLNETMETFQNFYCPNKKARFFEIADAINETNLILEPYFKNSQIKIIIKKENDKNECFNFKNEFQQIILSLILNAKDALLNIDAKYEKNIIINIIKKETHYEIYIEDNGSGISPDISKDIFKSFKTTKGKNGTGNGLYISKLIAERKLMGNLKLISSKNPTKFLLTISEKIN